MTASAELGDPTGATPRADGAALGAGALTVLALLSATPSLSTDLYLAGFPRIGVALHTTPSHVQLTLTAFLFGIGLGQLVWGPVSDRYGRRRPLQVGGVLCAIAAAVSALAPTIEVLIVSRFLQAFAGAAGIVIGRAIIADRLHGFRFARAMSLVATMTSSAPIAAPVFGGALLGLLTWRGVLGLLFVLAVVQQVGAAFALPESLPPAARADRIRFAGLLTVARRPAFLGYSLARMFAFGASMAYISSSPFVYQRLIGTSSFVYSVLFAVNASGMVTGNLVCARLSRRHIHPAKVVSFALPAMLAATCAVLVLAALGLPPWLLAFPLFATILSAGFLMGNLSALAMDQARDLAGSGSSVFGALFFLFGGLVSPLGGLGGGRSAVPLGITMTACTATALVCFAAVHRYVQRRPHLDRGFRPAAAAAPLLAPQAHQCDSDACDSI